MRSRTAFLLLACAVGLCAAEPVAQPAGRALAPSTCESCEALVQSFEAYLSSASTQEVVSEFITSVVCSQLPPAFQSTCEMEVSTVYAQAVSYVVTSLPPESVCATFGSCAPPSLLSLLSGAPSSVGMPFECQLCHLVATSLVQRLRDPVAREQIRGNLLAACGHLDAIGRAKCEADVSMLFASVDALAKDLDADKACEYAKFCAPAEVVEVLRAEAAETDALPSAASSQRLQERLLEASRASGVPPTPTFALALSAAFSALSGPAPRLEALSSPLAAAASCDECKVLIAQVVAVLADPKTQAEVLEFGKQACNAFPSFKDECVSYVTIYGPLALNVLLSYLQPDAICASVGYCPVPPALVGAGNGGGVFVEA